MMAYFAENPCNNSDIAYKYAPVLGNPIRILNSSHVAAIESAHAITKYTDPQARVLAGLFTRGHIAKVDVPAVPAVFKNDQIASELIDRLNKRQAPGRKTNTVSKAVQTAASHFTSKGIELCILDTNGLESVIDSEGNRITCTALLDDYLVRENATALSIAAELGATVVAVAKELIWDDYGLSGGDDFQPLVLSRRDHIALGNVTSDGSFSPLVTVLDTSHPAVAGQRDYQLL